MTPNAEKKAIETLQHTEQMIDSIVEENDITTAEPKLRQILANLIPYMDTHHGTIQRMGEDVCNVDLWNMWIGGFPVMIAPSTGEVIVYDRSDKSYQFFDLMTGLAYTSYDGFLCELYHMTWRGMFHLVMDHPDWVSDAKRSELTAVQEILNKWTTTVNKYFTKLRREHYSKEIIAEYSPKLRKLVNTMIPTIYDHWEDTPLTELQFIGRDGMIREYKGLYLTSMDRKPCFLVKDWNLCIFATEYDRKDRIYQITEFEVTDADVPEWFPVNIGKFYYHVFESILLTECRQNQLLMPKIA